MYRHLLRGVVLQSLRQAFVRTLSSNANIESKYAHKLNQAAERLNISVDELKAKHKEQKAEKLRCELQAGRASSSASPSTTLKPSKGRREGPNWTANARKDGSPVKPLSSILNFQKLLEKSHTPEQVTALWSAYHQYKSTSSGNSHIWATISVQVYQKMASMAELFSTFVIPVPRPPTGTANEAPHEFFFLQWDFHDTPPIPTANEDIFSPQKSTPASKSANPKASTILFTPLQEYKMRAAFATPYLVITHYTDLAHSHGIVLLRGEITPSSASSGNDNTRYLLSDVDAQQLSMAVQKFYLWGGEGARLLKAFHETPNDFRWEDVIKHATSTT